MIELNWQNIDTVLLDMDGTLLDLHFDNHFWLDYVPECYAQKHGISMEESNNRLMKKYTEVRGSLNWYCVDFWTKELELDIASLKRDVSHKIRVHPNVEPFLDAVNKAGKRTVLVTNAHQASLSLKMEITGIRDYFDKIIVSHDFGLAKEEDGFWHRLQQEERYNSEKTLLIDDNLEVLDSARDYGIKYLLAIHQPDSQQDTIESEHYQTIKNFQDITPEV